MKIWTVSNFGSDGDGYVTISAVEPQIDEHGLYHGGKFYIFHLDWKRQTTQLFSFSFNHGVPSFFGNCLKTWKDEVLTSRECLKYCEKNL